MKKGEGRGWDAEELHLGTVIGSGCVYNEGCCTSTNASLSLKKCTSHNHLKKPLMLTVK